MQCNRWTLSRLNGLSRFWTNAPASVSSTISVNTTKNGFRTSALRHAKQMPPRPKLDENEIEEAFLKGTGPGGQKINKTSSAVQLKHLPTGLVVKSQETRSRTQNRKIARRVLAEKLEEIQLGDQSRKAIKLEVARKKKSSSDKKKRRKYRLLEEEKTKSATGETGEKLDMEDDLDSPEREDETQPSLENGDSSDLGNSASIKRCITRRRDP